MRNQLLYKLRSSQGNLYSKKGRFQSASIPNPSKMKYSQRLSARGVHIVRIFFGSKHFFFGFVRSVKANTSAQQLTLMLIKHQPVMHIKRNIRTQQLTLMLVKSVPLECYRHQLMMTHFLQKSYLRSADSCLTSKNVCLLRTVKTKH